MRQWSWSEASGRGAGTVQLRFTTHSRRPEEVVTLMPWESPTISSASVVYIMLPPMEERRMVGDC